jgi:RNA polymerase sigma-70 factor (ECF subfamily)
MGSFPMIGVRHRSQEDHVTLTDSTSAALAAKVGPSETHRSAFSVNGASAPSLGAGDRGLVEAIRTGDPVAAAPLYRHLRPSIEQALHRVLRDRPPEFDDLMQITFERVIRTIAGGSFEGRSQLKTWASAIAAHVAVDWLRRRTQEQKLFEAMDSASVDPHAYNTLPERQLEARSEVRKVHGILRRMKPRRATILVLHDVLGHSVPQVAELLGIKVSAAQSRLRRARQEFVRRRTSTARPAVDA